MSTLLEKIKNIRIWSMTHGKDLIENSYGLILVVIGILVAAYFFDLDEIRSLVERGGIIGPIVLILAKASTMIFAPVSGSPLYPLAGALFGIWQGSLYLIIGDMIGSTVSFWISRSLGKAVVERFARGNVSTIEKIISFIETTRGFLIARVCFVALPEAVSYAAGLTRIHFWRFFLIHNAVGLVPTILLAGAGHVLVDMASQTWFVVVLLVSGSAVMAFGGWYFWKIVETKKPM